MLEVESSFVATTRIHMWDLNIASAVFWFFLTKGQISQHSCDPQSHALQSSPVTWWFSVGPEMRLTPAHQGPELRGACRPVGSVLWKSVSVTIAQELTPPRPFSFMHRTKWWVQYTSILKEIEVHGTKELLMLHKSHCPCSGQLLQLHLELIKVRKPVFPETKRWGDAHWPLGKWEKNASKQKEYKAAPIHTLPIVQWALLWRLTQSAYCRIGRD